MRLCTFFLAAAAAFAGELTDSEKESFLRSAKIVSFKQTDIGVTRPARAVLTAGEFTHDAQLQRIDVEKLDVRFDKGRQELHFKDSWEFNVAAYRLARLLGIHTVPPSVERRVAGYGTSAVTWWIDGVAMDEGTRLKKELRPPDPIRFSHQMELMRVFDELIYNTDRNVGNILITKDWTVWMIDHTRAFRRFHTLRRPQSLVRCERSVYDAMKRLDKPTLERELIPYLNKAEIDALLARRDALVEHFENKRRTAGDEYALFDLAAAN